MHLAPLSCDTPRELQGCN